ncbi:MAG: hypothetical protein OXU79_03055 [Gemmatimonadota bacterium]|nr:hypothetical protein [Gemmatimonadota bacterium]
MTTMGQEIKVEEGSGNVFTDIDIVCRNRGYVPATISTLQELMEV